MNASLATEGGWGETCAARGSDSSGKTAVTKIRSEQETFMIFLVLAGRQVAWAPGAINIHVRAGCAPALASEPRNCRYEVERDELERVFNRCWARARDARKGELAINSPYTH